MSWNTVPGFEKERGLSALDKAKQLRLQIRLIDKQMGELRQRKNRLKKELSQELENKKPYMKEYKKKNIHLYVLLLEDNKYYVGMTRNVEKRFKSHKIGKGALWTRKYPPIKILSSYDTGLNIEEEAALLENRLTIETAIEYGKDNVRGGGYCQTNPKWPKEVHQQEFSQMYQ